MGKCLAPSPFTDQPIYTELTPRQGPEIGLLGLKVGASVVAAAMQFNAAVDAWHRQKGTPEPGERLN